MILVSAGVNPAAIFVFIFSIALLALLNAL